MASAQVLPSSRKQEHLEAGKRRLEEFRKKKAAERAKKAASTNHANASNASTSDKNQLETEHVRITDSDGAGTSDGPSPLVVDNKNNNNIIKAIELAHESKQVSSDERHGNPSLLVNDFNFSTGGQIHARNQEIKKYDAPGNGPLGVNSSSGTNQMANYFEARVSTQDTLAYGHTPHHLFSHRSQASQDYDSSSYQSSFYAIEESKSKENDSSLKVSAVANPIFSQDFLTKVSPQSSLQSKASNASILGSDHGLSSLYEDSIQSTMGVKGSALEVGENKQGSAELREPITSDLGERKPSSLVSGFPSMHSSSTQISESVGFSFDVRSSSSHVPQYSAANETNSRRSRPSFLDSLNVSRAPSGSPFLRNEPTKETFMSHSSQFNGMDVLKSSIFQKPSTENGTEGTFSNLRTPDVPQANEHADKSSVSASHGGDLFRPGTNENSMDKKHEFYSPKQNEDFAALEQHIEDLTQEKFSLQRSLEASRALAESLASENSSLTDSYNQQRSVVNQLKSDMEKLQEEIKVQLAELEAVKMEYANAQLECNASDERAKILASEVIGLEEKALRLRSNELKLERQLENTQAEISSYKKKMSSLEKERQDLQSTIDALQEEKKVLQSKLRKASAGGKSIDPIKSPSSRKDMSTSTEDLENTDAISATSNEEMHNTILVPRHDASSVTMLPETGQSALETSSVIIPPDQTRMIQNIDALISELALEKEELVRALSSEASQNSKLKELNKELSRKLEAQTQRLELLTARSMASENISARQHDSRIIQDNTAYADEGDEVVERVLGWIMKLFPGGPPRRRTSKLI